MMHNTPLRRHWMPVDGLAFRPFFLLAALCSIVFLVVWLLFWQGVVVLQPYANMWWWHQHEMVFGFVIAVVTGFLLTAVRNWTGLPSLTGCRLWLLVVLWCTGRGMLAFPPAGLSHAVIASVDIFFLPVVALIMARLVWRARLWRNFVFVPLLLLMAAANLGMHMGALQANFQMAQHAAYTAVLLITLLMVILGGRVIPFFTSRKLNRDPVKPRKALEIGAVFSVMCLVAIYALAAVNLTVPTQSVALFFFIAGCFNLWRAGRWELKYCWHEPLLWGLQLSYFFITLGCFLWASALQGWIRIDIALHTLTIGAMATMILAMMARVSLGHTGRVIQTLPGIGLALALLLLAAVVRGLVLAFFPALAFIVYAISVLLWCVAYLIFLFHYTKPLLTVRADGAKG